MVRGDSGFIGWERVQKVTYVADRAYRVPVIVAHRWTIYFDDSTKTRTIEYPPGAAPRPRRIRRTIDELLAD